MRLLEYFDIERVKLSRGELEFSEKKGVFAEIETFVSLECLANVPHEIVHLKRGDTDALPASVYGKSHIRYVGMCPMISVEPDQNGNIEMRFVGPCAVSVIFNSEKVGSAGKNRGAHGRKKIYVVE